MTGKQIVLILFAITLLAAAGLKTFKNNKNIPENSTPVSTAANNPPISPNESDSWKSHQSTKFNYSFKYPGNWNINMFNEDDAAILYGSNSLQNYSPTGIEKYMDHGITDWKGFLGEKPGIKIDFAVYSKNKGPNNFQDGAEFVKTLVDISTKTEPPDLTIGKLPTEQYKKTKDLGPTDIPELNTFISYPSGDRVIYMHLMFWNVKSYEDLKKTAGWQELKQILSTFKF